MAWMDFGCREFTPCHRGKRFVFTFVLISATALSVGTVFWATPEYLTKLPLHRELLNGRPGANYQLPLFAALFNDHLPRRIQALRKSIRNASQRHAVANFAHIAGPWLPNYSHLAGVHCSELISGTRRVVSKAAAYVDRKRKTFDCSADHVLRNASCDTVMAAGYDRMNSNSAKSSFPLAYGLRMHTCAAQAELLLRAIYAPQNVYCLHLDGHAESAVIDAMRNIASCLPNVHLAPLDKDFVYASASQMHADLTCMRTLLASPVRWRYFLNVAGQEMPIKTNSEIVEMLKLYNGSNEIQSRFHPGYRYRYQRKFWCRDSIQNKTVRCTNQNIRKSRPPGHVVVYKGSGYGFFARSFVVYMLDKRGFASRLYEWFNDTYAPEEHYFATLARVLGAPGGFNRPNHTLPASRNVLWSGSRTRCRGRFVRQVCVLGVRDLQRVTGEPEAFANKFRIDVDPLAMHCVAELILNRTLLEIKSTDDDIPVVKP